MKDLELGIAQIEYNEYGQATQATFSPTMKIDIDPTLLQQITDIDVKDNPDIIKENANYVFASWFAKTNEIELADRDHYGIDTEIVDCQKDSNGIVRVCRIKFVFKELTVSL